MTFDLTQRATALIEHIQTRFHDGHRRALPELMTMAAAVEAQGIDKGLGDALSAIGHALEQHMFKEEMRLFPMMEQGGNTLIGRLIEDLHREHLEHEQGVACLQARVRGLAQVHRTNATCKHSRKRSKSLRMNSSTTSTLRTMSSSPCSALQCQRLEPHPELQHLQTVRP